MMNVYLKYVIIQNMLMALSRTGSLYLLSVVEFPEKQCRR